MLAFRDIFVLQIIGILQDRKFSGQLRIKQGRQNASVTFSDGNIGTVHLGKQIDQDALKDMLWWTHGELELLSDVSTPGHIDYAQMLEDLLQTDTPAMPAACPMMEAAVLERKGLKPAQQSAFRDAGFNILLRISKDSPVHDIRQDMANEEFWPALLYLASNGQVLFNYEPTLGKLMRDLQNDISSKMEKLLGQHVCNTFSTNLSKKITDAWPECGEFFRFDPIYGAAPYYHWAKTIKTTLAEIGTSTMTSHCYEKAVERLSPADNMLFEQLTKL